MSEAKKMQIDSRGIKILAKSTIRSWIEAVVELVTNSDDAYKRLENDKQESSGKIDISLSKKAGGEWEKFEIRDEAGGISKKNLKDVVIFFVCAHFFFVEAISVNSIIAFY